MSNETFPTNTDILIEPERIQLGPGFVYVGTTPPSSGSPPNTPTLTNGEPADGYFLGMTAGPSSVTWTPQYQESKADVAQGPSNVIAAATDLTLDVLLKEFQVQALRAAFPAATTYVSDDTVTPHITTFGSDDVEVATASVLLVVPRIMTQPLEFITFMLYRAYNAGAVELSFARQKSTLIQVTFKGLVDFTRDAGDLIGQLAIPSTDEGS